MEKYCCNVAMAGSVIFSWNNKPSTAYTLTERRAVPVLESQTVARCHLERT